MRRFDDWPERLNAFIRSRRSMPYAYGTNDCATMVRDAVRVLTGEELMPGFVPPTSRIAGARFLLAGGYGDVEGLATKFLGPPLSSPWLARRGDVVSFFAAGEMHLALVAGEKAVTPTSDGLAWVALALWCKGWRVG